MTRARGAARQDLPRPGHARGRALQGARVDRAGDAPSSSATSRCRTRSRSLSDTPGKVRVGRPRARRAHRRRCSPTCSGLSSGEHRRSCASSVWSDAGCPTSPAGGRRSRSIVPSTNTVVEHDMSRSGVRPASPSTPAACTSRDPTSPNDERVRGAPEQINESIDDAVDRVLTCKPDYLLMGMSAAPSGAASSGNAAFERSACASGPGCRSRTGAAATAAALERVRRTPHRGVLALPAGGRRRGGRLLHARPGSTS